MHYEHKVIDADALLDPVEGTVGKTWGELNWRVVGVVPPAPFGPSSHRLILEREA